MADTATPIIQAPHLLNIVIKNAAKVSIMVLPRRVNRMFIMALMVIAFMILHVILDIQNQASHVIVPPHVHL